MAFCTECGKELSAGLRFCPECGAAVVASQRPASEPAPQVNPVGAQSSAEPAPQVDPVGARSSAPADEGGIETAPVAQQASEPPIVPVVKDAAEAVKAAIPEFPSAGGVVETLAPAEVGKVTLSTWKSVPPVAQAIGTAVGQAQKVVRAAESSSAQTEESTQPASGNQTEQFKSHGPTAHRSSSGGGAKPVDKKKQSKLPFVAIGAGAVLIIAALLLYVVPLFQFQPHDPNEGKPLTSDSAASASASANSPSASSGATGSSSAASTSASASAASASASSTAASSASAESTSSGSSTSEPSGGATTVSSEAAPPVAPTSYSTAERPTINEFKWMTGETDKGNAPAGVARITDFGAVMGGWKAYMYGSNLERLLNVTIDAGQSGAVVTLDWYYIRDNKAGSAFEDTTASSTFTGAFDGGMLDAAGSGRITLTAFWEQDGHQYATGSFMWPSGETDIIALVRP